MSTVERMAIRYVSYGAYAMGVTGAAVSIGGVFGWVLLAVAGAVPGGVLLVKDVERRGIERDIVRARPTAPVGDPGPVPDPL